ncbi:efflux RND transporter permease subunit [Dongia deserti]|uniref:efflux RND transporter permease subunit n=1 Tax=Dongia deserti TaxID=2268030 RepID=UPI000E65844B|nr:efflux RND transporter permease subunit [Dongia deserti]
MSRLVEGIIANSRVVLAGLVLLLLAGWVTYKNLPKELWPDIQLPFIYISMTLEGVSPDDAERLLARPMEQQIRSIEGLKEFRSLTYQGGASVVLEFQAGYDIDKALDDVREQVDLAKPDLPEDTDEPFIQEVAFSRFPVLVVTLSGDVPERSLRQLAERLQDKIESVPSVLEATMSGEREELVELVIDPLRIEAYGLALDEIGTIVARSNRLVAAGMMDTGQGRFAIKVPGLFESADDILSMPVKVSGDAVVQVKDIASLRRTFKDPESVARIDGLPAIGIEVSKRAGENIIETINQVRTLVSAESQSWPPQVKVTFSQDSSQQIRDMLGELENSLITAVLLVLIVVVASLGLRGGLIVGIAVPGSFLIGLLMLAGFGITINIVVLFSLIMATGMLVDGAIILVEFADRCMLNGMDRRAAYAEATKRMAWPIFSSIATIIAAFGPMAFWPGTTGEFMKYLPITLSATLFASLLMAMVFIPCIGALIGKPNAEERHAFEAERLSGEEQLARARGPDWLYLIALRGALRRPVLVILGGIGILVATVMAFGSYGAGVEFFPDVEPERAQVQIHARGNMSVKERDDLVKAVEREILALNSEHHELRSVYSVTRADVGGRSGGQELAEDVIGTIALEFGDWDKRRSVDMILSEIRERTAPIPGIRIELTEEEGGPGGGKPVSIQLTSTDFVALEAATEIVRKKLESMPGLIDVQDSRPVPGIEWELAVDRTEAAKYGLDVTAVGDVIQLVTRGLKFGDYRPDDADDEIDIVARFPSEVRNISEIDQLRIPTANGSVPLSNFVDRTAKPKLALVRRVDGVRVIDVESDVKPGVQAYAELEAIKAWLATDPGLDPSVNVAFTGEDEDRQESANFLTLAAIATMFLITLILLLQFNSFFSVFLVLSAVIMSSIGVMFGLLVLQQPFGIVMTGIGVIALAGIIVNNNIVLIDTYDHLKKTAKSRREALLVTGVQRLRPVILTKLTTVLGLLPLVFHMTVDFIGRDITFYAPSTQWWAPLATAITFGVLFASPLTLIFTPCALELQGRFYDWLARRRDRTRQIGAEPAQAE